MLIYVILMVSAKMDSPNLCVGWQSTFQKHFGSTIKHVNLPKNLIYSYASDAEPTWGIGGSFVCMTIWVTRCIPQFEEDDTTS